MRNTSQHKSFFPSCVLILLIFFIGWQASTYYHAKSWSNLYANNDQLQADETVQGEMKNNVRDVNLNLLFTVWEKLRDTYVDETKFDDQKQVYGLIQGLVTSLNDPYTIFMTPEESRQFQDSLNGQLEGIGAELTIEEGNLIVVSPLKGSPAERAGLKPGDIIYKINEEFASEMTLFEAIMKIRGPKETSVFLTILHKDETKPVELTIVRDSINIASVSWEEKSDGIAYLSINQFSDNTKEEFKKAVTEILLKKPQGIILDLRFNGGGYLEISVDILSELFKSKEKVVSIQQRKKRLEENYFTDGSGRLANIPLVVLVNNGSASASEIVAGAIQDYKIGTIVGEQTFGKGTVQEVETLEDGSSLRLTIAKWFTPNGRSIDTTGITPDKVVEMTEEDTNNNRDTQLESSIDYLQGNL